MTEYAPGRFWIIMHRGNVVAKFDTAGKAMIPDEIVDYDDFVILELSNRSDLASRTIDQSGLSDEEKNCSERSIQFRRRVPINMCVTFNTLK